MTITARLLPILSDNYAWLLRDEATGAVAAVDPADADAVGAAVAAEGGRLDLILLTHHHADHVAGTDALRARFPAPVVGAAADAHRLPRLDRAVAEGDTVALGASAARVIDTPGHTVGHIAFHFPDGAVLLCGDTLFSLGCGRRALDQPAAARVIDTPGHTVGHIAFHFPDGAVLLCGDTLFSLGCGRLIEGTAAQMFDSLRKFAVLPGETLVCCGHEYTESNARFALHADPGNAALQARAREVARLRANGQPTLPSRIADELMENPFMRAPDAATLADLRSRKDRFR